MNLVASKRWFHCVKYLKCALVDTDYKFNRPNSHTSEKPGGLMVGLTAEFVLESKIH